MGIISSSFFSDFQRYFINSTKLARCGCVRLSISRINSSRSICAFVGLLIFFDYFSFYYIYLLPLVQLHQISHRVLLHLCCINMYVGISLFYLCAELLVSTF
uniref:Uncharacterized protein n=1 Tax=uncultured marine virus TaxID=186617 RepID=A0A0F7L1B6_9VIRU|nr:hypothetical protein [uncultured marine virus]